MIGSVHFTPFLPSPADNICCSTFRGTTRPRLKPTPSIFSPTTFTMLPGHFLSSRAWKRYVVPQLSLWRPPGRNMRTHREQVSDRRHFDGRPPDWRQIPTRSNARPAFELSFPVATVNRQGLLGHILAFKIPKCNT